MRHQKLDELLRLKSTGEISPEQREELETLIRTDGDARRQYVDYTTVDAMLKWQFGQTAVPVKAKRPRVITYARALTAAAALLLLGLGIHFWLPVEPKGPTGDQLPILVESKYGKPHTLSGWRFLPALDADYEVLGPARVRLSRGEAYAASTPYAQGQRPHLEIETPAGNVTAKGTRFYVSTSDEGKEEGMQRTRVLIMTGIVGLSNFLGSAEAGAGELLTATPKTAPQKLMQEGNYREALDIYEKLVVDPAHTGEAAARDLHAAQVCMKELGRIDFWDALVETSVDAHPKDWRVLWAAAMGYYAAGSWGYMVDGSFHRGGHIRNGREVNAYERDRIRSLQLMQQTMSHISSGADPIAAGRFYEDFSKVLRSGGATWRLQMLTDLSELPDHDAPGHLGSTSLAPVDADNRPVIYESPKRWKDACSDGERWRFLMRRAGEANPARKLAIDLHYANFLRHQFGVQTLGELVRRNRDGQPDGGLYAIHTLKDNETLARLAAGVQRLKLDSDTNFIKTYRDIAAVKVALPVHLIRDLTYKYYEGDWDELPDLAELTPTSTGVLKKGLIDVGVSPREDYFGLVFEGQLPIPEDGEYTFFLHSDDGAKLTLGDNFVLDNDGVRSAATGKTGKVKLKEGFVPLKLTYFQKGGYQSVQLRWSGPGFESMPLSKTTQVSPQEAALTALAEIFENRRQLSKAADIWKESIERFGPGKEGFKTKRLSQIVDDWGRLEKHGMQIAGRNAGCDFTFRNARQVRFTAHRVKLDLFLEEVKAHLKSDPEEIDRGVVGFQGRQQPQERIAHLLISRDDKKLLGERVAEWDVALQPAEGHWDKRITVETPLEEAGLYMVEARVGKGNTTRVLVWLTHAVIVDRSVDNHQLYFLADATTGKPISNANLEFFGFRIDQERVRNRETGGYHTLTKTLTENFAERTDESGMVSPELEAFRDNFTWLITATDSKELLAVHGFLKKWDRPLVRSSYQKAKAYVVTDRPVYRPGQAVNISAWIRQARYDLENISSFAARDVRLRLTGPRGKRIFDRKVRTGTYGELQQSWSLPEDASLGNYQLVVWILDPTKKKRYREERYGSLSFRVEEYKKPEYEVKVEAPTEPVRLGDTIEATITANYYFGAPVTDAQVKFKVTRQRHDVSWVPPRRWDWFYGPGYWWFTEAHDWYPGWKRWGCVPPIWSTSAPKEIVQEQTVAIGTDGTVKVRIDTAVAKALHGDIDHRYEITAEVIDASRRTIVGKGSVIAARQPFKVHAWLNGGHFEVGEEIVASFMGRTPDGKPVQGKGVATLYKIRYDDEGQPVEEKVRDWKLDPAEDGTVQLSVHAHQNGQYRLAYTLTDAKGRQREGGVLVPIRGKGFDGSGFRFNDLEIVLDKAEYAPGERAKVMVSTSQRDSTVALFIRPQWGIYPKPILLNPTGGAEICEIEITRSDMPNIFVEAFTVKEGKVYSVKRKIVVPPTKRVLTVDLEPSKKRYKPSETGSIKIRLRDIEGKPFQGHAVVTIYDKSLEYISSELPQNISAYFWKWQREHRGYGHHSLARSFDPLLRKGEVEMGFIGRYGRHFMRFADSGHSRVWRMAASKSGAASETRSYADTRIMARSGARGKSGGIPLAAFTKDAGGAVEAAQLVEAQVRKAFADTAFWKADIVTDEQGYAEIEVPMPDNLTTWKVKVWAMGHGTVVGQGETEVITSKDLLVRLQAPRFFVEKDEVILSAIVHNYLGSSREVKVSLELEGDHLTAKDLVKGVNIDAGGDERVDWLAKVRKEGQVTVRMKAQTRDDADAMEMSFPVYVHGALRTESWSGVLRPGEEKGVITLDVPKERRPEQTHLEIRYSPSIALAMVDALPYLANYPHRNCESAINRFVPVVVTQKILKDLGVDLETIANKATNLNPQEIGDAGERASQWNRRNRNPIFEGVKVDRMVKAGLADLTRMQNTDGGWSWTQGGDSDTYMTALVVSNLKLASDNGLALVPKMLERGVKYLEAHQKRQVQRLQNAPAREKPYKLSADNLDAFLFEVLARTGKVNKEMQEYLYRDRLKLSRYSQALFALGLDHAGAHEQRDMIVRNLSQFLVRDEENQTAYLDLPQNRFWWCWYDNQIETQAAYLKLLVSLDPKGEATSGLAKYLLNNRKHGTYWNSTRDTAFCLEALAGFVKASGEIEPNMTVEVLIDGQSRKEIVITPDNLFTFDNVVELKGESVKTGRHEVVFRRKGKGPLYYNAYLTTFSLEDFIKAAGLEVKVKRNHYRLVPQDHKINSTGSRGQLVSQRVDHLKRVKLKHGETVKSGDLVEVELVIDSKNDYEYLLFEDYKPAGFEAVELRSGHRWNGLGAYTEYRDEKVTFQVCRLSRGRHTLWYRLRAEVPGSFSALPTQVNGVYAPELRANSDEIRLKVK